MIDRELFSKAVCRAYVACIEYNSQCDWKEFKKRAYFYYTDKYYKRHDHKPAFLKLLRKNANVWSILRVTQTKDNVYVVVDYNQQRLDVVNTPELLWESKVSILRLCEDGTHIDGVGTRSSNFLSLNRDTHRFMVVDPTFFVELTPEERKADERQQRREAV